MSAYIKKMETVQKQHAFPVVAWCQSSDSRTSQFEFQIQRSQQKTTPCGVVILCDQPGHVSPHHTGVTKDTIQRELPKDSATGSRRGCPAVLESEHPPCTRRSWVGPSVKPCFSIRRLQQFGNQGQLGKQLGNVHLQGRTESLRIRMRQLISPLVVIPL